MHKNKLCEGRMLIDNTHYNFRTSSKIQSIFSISHTNFGSRVSPSFMSKSEIILGSHVRGHTPSNSNTYPIRIIQIPAGEPGENNYERAELIKC